MRNRLVLLVAVLLFLLNPVAAQQSSELPNFELAIETSLNPVIFVDAVSGKILLANPPAARLFGVALDGQNISRLLGLDTKHPISSLHGKVLELQDPTTGEMTYQHFSIQGLYAGKNSYYTIMIQEWGDQHRLFIRNRYLVIALFSLLAVMLVIVTVFLIIQSRLMRQVKGEQQRQQTMLELWQRFLDTDERITSVRDKDGRFIIVNSAFASLFNKPRQELIGKTMHSLLDEQFRKVVEEDDRKILTDGEPIHIVRNNLGYAHQIHKFALTFPDGSAGVGSIVTDITEQQKTEQILKEHLERAKKLSEMLSSTFTSDQKHLDRGLELACELTGSTTALLLMFNQKDELFSIVSSCPDNLPTTELTRSITQHYRNLLMDGKAHIENEGPFSTPLATALANTLTSLMSVPFYTEGTLGGVVLVANSPVAYDEQDGVQLQLLFSALHTATQKQTREHQLEESRQSMRLILDSTAEGIFGMDSEGRCTFCNASCLKLLGYDDERELLNKEIHRIIHHTRREGEYFCNGDCSIMSTIGNGVGVMAEDEVFWRKDGSSFSVLAYSYPQIKEGKVVGTVVTFTDDTERMETLKRIEYLSRHDQLTGLKNRMSFDEELVSIEAVIPTSIIVGDVNSLKLTNDIFGHTTGDQLLKQVAAVLQNHCPSWASVYRIGGDEFVIILPHSDEQFANSLIEKILEDFEGQEFLDGRQTIALGAATRTTDGESISEIFDIAENHMYREKALRLRETQRLQLNRLLSLLFKKSPREEHHAEQVQRHALFIGEILGLSKETLSLLGRAAYHHDIGKLALSESLIRTSERDGADQRAYQSHVSAGYRILNTFEETVDLSEYVLHHHEWYNGEGYLKGLKGNEIPYLSRILRIAEIWEREALDRSDPERIKTILNQVSGIEADPQMVERILVSL
jgi:diguanylate cyclase (GGDEF)-like protein/PAS domain S-box-containing protein